MPVYMANMGSHEKTSRKYRSRGYPFTTVSGYDLGVVKAVLDGDRIAALARVFLKDISGKGYGTLFREIRVVFINGDARKNYCAHCAVVDTDADRGGSEAGGRGVTKRRLLWVRGYWEAERGILYATSCTVTPTGSDSRIPASSAPNPDIAS